MAPSSKESKEVVNLTMVTENLANEITFQWSILNINQLSGTIHTSKFAMAYDKPEEWFVSMWYDKADDMLFVDLTYSGKKDAPPIHVSSRSRILHDAGSEKYQEHAYVFHSGSEHRLFYLKDLVASSHEKLVFRSNFTVHGYDVVCRRQLFHEECDQDVKQLKSDYAAMLNFPEFADVEIKVGSRTFLAHKSVLKHLAPKLFTDHQEDIEKGEFALGMDFNPKIFDVVLNSIYSGKADHNVIEQCWDQFYPIAVKYDLKRLLKVCRKEMLEEMSVEKVCEFYGMAIDNNDREMVDYCKEFVQNKVPDWESNERYKDMMKIDQ